MDPLDKLSREKLIFYLTVPLSSIIIFSNLFIIIGIACNRQLHNTPNYFFLSLLVADLCTGITLPFIPHMTLDRQLDFKHCLVMYIFPNFLFLSFLFNLVMVHYERYLCIVSPLHHSQFWVHRCFPLALLTVWLPPLLYASLPAFGWNNWDEVCSYKQVFPKAFIYLEVCGLVLPAMLSIVAMMGRVLWIARKQLQNICKLHRAVDRLQQQQQQQQQQPSDQEQQLNLRYAKCVAAVSLTFLVCWVPYIIYQLMSVTMLQTGVSLPSSSLYIIMSCTGIGSMAIIPLILGLANKQYTEPISRLMLKLRNPEFSASLLQSSVSHDPSEIILIC
uniref:G-protein coupled bile acid receptor 1 n=1 Tax=Sinocyclocheilus grahami TaxID=75366 RepID=A0A672JYQ5_SINGR